MNHTPVILSGWQYRLARIKMSWGVWQIARMAYSDGRKAWMALVRTLKAVRFNHQFRYIGKGVQHEGLLYGMVGMPGFPSPAWKRMVRNELHRQFPISGHPGSLFVAILALTRKCPLNCVHCVEYPSLNQKDVLTLEDWKSIMRKCEAHGVAQVEISGGEPLNRLEEILILLDEIRTDDMDVWILTSGYHLTVDKARQLKSVGLQGVSISLDHWDPAIHDAFRGREGSYDWVIKAVRHALEAGLLVSLSIVPTRESCNRHDLMLYADLARELGVHFIRILEPRAIGRFAGQEVELSEHERMVLDRFVHDLQYHREFRNYPPIEYHGTYLRQMGCVGCGSRYLYMDTAGMVHRCPFSSGTFGNLVEQDLKDILDHMNSDHSFCNSTIHM